MKIYKAISNFMQVGAEILIGHPYFLKVEILSEYRQNPTSFMKRYVCEIKWLEGENKNKVETVILEM